MNQERSVTIRMPEDLLSSALRAASVEDMSAADLIRTALADRVAELKGEGKRDPVGVIRRALRRDFSQANDWVDLQQRLRRQKLILREVENEIWLFTWPVEKKLLPLTRLGLTREDLTLLYRTPFPKHGMRDGMPLSFMKVA